MTAVRGLEDAARSAGIDVPLAAPSGVYSAETSRVGAQVTPSGVRPLVRSRGDLGSAETVDAKALTDSVIEAAGLRAGRRRLTLALAVIGAIVVGVAVFLVVRSTRAADPSAAPPARVASGSARVASGAAAGAGAAAGSGAMNGSGATTGSGAIVGAGSAGAGSGSAGSGPAPAGSGPAPAGSGDTPGSGAAAATVVTVQIHGPPSGTEVYGPGGKLLGVAPGPVQLARADADVVLTLKADGYVTRSATVHVAADTTVEVALHKKAAPHHRTPHRRRPRTSTTGPAAGATRIEDPFAH